jgi:hypothetical protein
MGKDKKEAKTNSKELSSDTKSEYNTAQAGNDQRLTNLDTQNAASRAELAGLYRGMGGANGQITAGQADTGRLASTYDAATAFGENGGYSPEREASIMENVAGLKEFGKTGGLTAEDANRFRANGTYEEFNRTGGYTDADTSRIRQAALAPISGYAQTTQDELNRRQAVQGGYGPGFDAAARALRRDTGKGMYEAGLNSEMAIKNAVNSGRQWGAQGMTSSEGAYQGLKTSNQLAGLKGAADVETTLQNSISQYRMAGMSLASATAKAIADVDLSNIGNKMNADSFNVGQQNTGIQGLAGLYNQDYNSAEHLQDLKRGYIDDEYGNRQASNQQLNQILMTPGVGQQLLMQGVGAFAGAAGGALTGGVGTALNAAAKAKQSQQQL